MNRSGSWLWNVLICIISNTNHRVRIWEKIFQLIKEALIFHQLGIYIIQLCHTHCCCFSDIRIFVFQTFPQWLAKVLRDLVNTNATHCTNCQSSNQRIWVLAVLKPQISLCMTKSLFSPKVKKITIPAFSANMVHGTCNYSTKHK